MDDLSPKIISQCQNVLKTEGLVQISLDLPKEIYKLSKNFELQKLDSIFGILTQKNGKLFKLLSHFEQFSEIEYIISFRNAEDPYEEDGIWHDDGSRKLAYSISLTTQEVLGGNFCFRKKQELSCRELPTPPYGTLTIFKTGSSSFEHKITQVLKGKRLITAGWLS